MTDVPAGPPPPTPAKVPAWAAVAGGVVLGFVNSFGLSLAALRALDEDDPAAAVAIVLLPGVVGFAATAAVFVGAARKRPEIVNGGMGAFVGAVLFAISAAVWSSS